MVPREPSNGAIKQTAAVQVERERPSKRRGSQNFHHTTFSDVLFRGQIAWTEKKLPPEAHCMREYRLHESQQVLLPPFKVLLIIKSRNIWPKVYFLGLSCHVIPLVPLEALVSLSDGEVEQPRGVVNHGKGTFCLFSFVLSFTPPGVHFLGRRAENTFMHYVNVFLQKPKLHKVRVVLTTAF